MSAERGSKPRAETSGAVLEHIEQRGRWQGFSAPRQKKLALMKAAIEQGLFVWNETVGKYEQTMSGHKRLKEYRHKMATGV